MTSSFFFSFPFIL